MPEVIKRKIVIQVGYYDFVFDDLIAANAFAYVAKAHLADGDKERDVRILVDYERVEEAQEDDQATD